LISSVVFDEALKRLALYFESTKILIKETIHCHFYPHFNIKLV